jgi:hypothetical protein
MQKKSNSVKEFIQFCSRYEEFEFHKLQEVEHHYILIRKYYLAKAFARELAVKLENNKIVKPSSFGLSEIPSNSSVSTEATCGSNSSSPSAKN